MCLHIQLRVSNRTVKQVSLEHARGSELCAAGIFPCDACLLTLMLMKLSAPDLHEGGEPNKDPSCRELLRAVHTQL